MRLCVPWVKESIARFEVRSRAKKPHGATKWREPVFVSANQDQTALRVVRLHERLSPLEQVYRRYGRYVAAVILAWKVGRPRSRIWCRRCFSKPRAASTVWGAATPHPHLPAERAR